LDQLTGSKAERKSKQRLLKACWRVDSEWVRRMVSERMMKGDMKELIKAAGMAVRMGYLWDSLLDDLMGMM
jgi:replicative DNA helicase